MEYVMKYYKKFIGERVYLSPMNIDDVNKYLAFKKWNDVKLSLILLLIIR